MRYGATGGFTDAYVAQSRALLQTNNLRAAMASVNQALQLAEDLVEAHDLRGRIFMYMSDNGVGHPELHAGRSA